MALASASDWHQPAPLVRACYTLGACGELYLNGVAVGSVVVTGYDTSWGFARFRRGPGFEPFAPAFDLWSILLHEGTDRLDRSTAANLAVVENAMDRIRARLRFADGWVDLAQVNIDGELLEWKQY